MKDLFICLLINIAKFGKMTSANFYNEDWSNLKIDTGDCEYEISIFRKAKEEKEDA
jgi:hypothetical protein